MFSVYIYLKRKIYCLRIFEYGYMNGQYQNKLFLIGRIENVIIKQSISPSIEVKMLVVHNWLEITCMLILLAPQ